MVSGVLTGYLPCILRRQEFIIIVIGIIGTPACPTTNCM